MQDSNSNTEGVNIRMDLAHAWFHCLISRSILYPAVIGNSEIGDIIWQALTNFRILQYASCDLHTHSLLSNNMAPNILNPAVPALGEIRSLQDEYYQYFSDVMCLITREMPRIDMSIYDSAASMFMNSPLGQNARGVLNDYLDGAIIYYRASASLNENHQRIFDILCEHHNVVQGWLFNDVAHWVSLMFFNHDINRPQPNILSLISEDRVNVNTHFAGSLNVLVTNVVLNIESYLPEIERFALARFNSYIESAPLSEAEIDNILVNDSRATDEWRDSLDGSVIEWRPDIDFYSINS